ncbi:transcriptional antiterminator, BglG [Clostridium sp. DL-VIII]|uniref:BglG family transcription antiterminator n=1 Tax=Clostridium sp. DL-VIII TaxID=641107 RepID=UPI00023AF232|nr:HTH domain-containing protein [Clostridium sp. DL-VIII]EHI97662.1 transcriptional antiterminator, BglG [Clostridium sp. DL-VIII]
MNRRYRDILSIILNTDECITGNELARLCNVTIRTIRHDIKEINVLLKEYNVEIDSKVKKGYFLNKENKEVLKKNNIIRKVLDYEYIIETPNLPLERQMYILLKLTTKKYITVEELAESLYVSEATINNDVILINKWLKKDLKLGISYSLNEGITLKANEKEKRNIISWVLSIKTNVSTITKYWNYLFEEKDVIIVDRARDLYHIVSAETKKYNYYLSGHSAQLLCYEILVAVKRCQLGFNLNDLDDINDDLIPVMTEVREKVEKDLEVNLSKTEWLNLQQYFKSKQFLHGTNIINIETEEAICIVDEFLITLHDKFKIDLSFNPDNKYKLLLYVAPMINRLKYRHCIPNKIREKVTQTYKTEFKMATEIAYIIKRKLNLNMELIELAYITIHLVSMSGMWKYKLYTAIVCDYDESIISFIKDKIDNHFGEKIKISKIYDYQEFMYENDENLKKIEFIISTSTIADITNIPFIRINPEIESNDIDMISEYLDNHKSKL